MSFSRAFLALLLCCASLAASSCGASSTGEQPQESNTNWLITCDADAQCGEERSCQCGVCTVTCEQSNCPERLTCLAESECGGSAEAASCQQACARNADCAALDPDAECVSGVCALESGGLTTAQLSEPLPDAGAPPEAATCRHAYVEYQEGDWVLTDGCDSRGCECDADGEWACSGTSAVCPFVGMTQPCSEMFPGVEPGELPGDSIEIFSASINADTIAFEVSHGGGCERHDYALCFGPAGESYPVGIDLHLIHDAHGDTCEEGYLLTLPFDLTPVAEAFMEDYQAEGGVVRTQYGLYTFGELACEDRDVAAGEAHQAARDAASTACERDQDCELVNDTTGCAVGCPIVLSAEGAVSYEAALQSIDAAYCQDYEAAGCGPVLAPPCEGISAVGCVEGQCTGVEPTAEQRCMSGNPPTQDTESQLQAVLENADCSDLGLSDVMEVISEDAARCIADSAGLPEGLAPWSANLVCHAGHEAIVWNVSNVEFDDSSSSGGSSYSIDAQTGDVLAQLGWSAQP